MKKCHYLLLLITFIYACKQHESAVREKKPSYEFKPSDGRIYHSESFLPLSDSLSAVLFRSSIEQYSTPGDTISGSFVKDSKDTVIYYVQTQPGEQFEISFSNKVRIWLRESSNLGVVVVGTKIISLTLCGEAFIVNTDPLLITAKNTFSAHMTRKSCLNLRSYPDDDQSIISPFNGTTTVRYFDKYKSAKEVSLTLGQRFLIDNSDSTSLYNKGSLDIGIWANTARIRWDTYSILKQSEYE